MKRFAIGAAVIAVAATLLSAAPAQAAINPTPPGGNPSRGASIDLGRCNAVSNSRYLGLTCGNNSTDVVDVAAVLGRDPVPTCWFEPLGAEDLVANGVANVNGYVWYWKRCVTGISKNPNRFAPQFELFAPEAHPVDTPPTTLTERQRALIGTLDTRRTTIPAPRVGTFPSVTPSVGSLISFVNAGEWKVGVNAGGVDLRARILSMTIAPLGVDNPERVWCRSAGYRARAGEKLPRNPRDAICDYAYEHSSAGQEDDAFPVSITAHWITEYSMNDGRTWTRFNQFDRTEETKLRVFEIQALNVY